MLTPFQQKMLEASISFLFEDIAECSDKPLALLALKSLDDSAIYTSHQSKFTAIDIITSIDKLREILQHPCPQNRSTGNHYVGQEPGLVVWRDPISKRIMKEPQGFLSLTTQSTANQEPVTKEDVVAFIFKMAKEYEDNIQQGLEATENLSQADASSSRQGQFFAHNPTELYQKEAISRMPMNAAYYNNRGYAKYDLGQYEAAIADYDEAIRLRPESTVYYYNRGNAKYDLGQYEAAIADYDEAIRLAPEEDADYYHRRGYAELNLGQYGAAKADFDEAIRLAPENDMYYNIRGYAKHNLGQYEAALADYDEAIRLDPEEASAYNKRSYTKHILGRHEAALADLDEALRLEPEEAVYYNHRGHVKLSLGQYEAALADYNEAIRLRPEKAEYYGSRGYVKNDLGQYEAALADLDEAIRLAPEEDADYYHRRGYAKHNLGQYEAALADYNEAIRRAPEKAAYYNNRGYLNYKHTEYKAAKNDFEKALTLDDNNWISHYYLGRLVERSDFSKDPKTAETFYQNARAKCIEAIDKEKHNSVLYYRLGVMADKGRGKTIDENEAIDYYKKAIEAKGNFFFRQKALGRLKKHEDKGVVIKKVFQSFSAS